MISVQNRQPRTSAPWDEIKVLQDTCLKVWNLYINWFTWSLGANLLAISWIATSKTKPNSVFVGGLGLVMMFSLILCVVGSVFVGRYFKAVAAQATMLANDANTDPTGQARINDDSVRLIFGSNITHYVPLAITCTLAAVAAGWLAIIIYFGFLGHSLLGDAGYGFESD
jgi:hypothetical protein